MRHNCNIESSQLLDFSELTLYDLLECYIYYLYASLALKGSFLTAQLS